MYHLMNRGDQPEGIFHDVGGARNAELAQKRKEARTLRGRWTSDIWF